MRVYTPVCRQFYTRVTTERLDAMAAEYRGSAEEEADLAEAYTSTGGDMTRVMEAMMFSTIEDESRYREVLQSKIDRGELLKTRKFSAEPPGKKARRKERAEREAVEAEQHARGEHENPALALLETSSCERTVR